MIYVYMIKMIAGMQFILCLDMLEVMGVELELCEYD